MILTTTKYKVISHDHATGKRHEWYYQHKESAIAFADAIMATSNNFDSHIEAKVIKTTQTFEQVYSERK